ncbi:MAG: hypothetical protein AAFV86_15685 [Pseudomonadota bacterium]
METARGAAPVGRLEDLGAVEATAVLYLRLWCSGPDAQGIVWNDFAATFGGREGRVRLHGFECLVTMLVEQARRPLMRHDPGCRCLGADESAFATLIGSALDGDRAEAAAMAALLVRATAAPAIAEQARLAGLAVADVARRLVRTHDREAAATHASTSLRQ